MLEKLKDIFYDLNDLLVTLIIILVIIFSIASIMTNAFDLDLNSGSVFDFIEQNKPLTETPLATTEPVTTAAESPESALEPPLATPPTVEPPATVEAGGENVNLVLAQGTSLGAFARKMQETGVITDSASFVQLVVSQGLDRKLQTGSYEFKKGMTDADALKVLFP